MGAQRRDAVKRKDFFVGLSNGVVQYIQEYYKGLMLSYNPTIIIFHGQKGSDEMDTWIHETLHVSLPKASEAEVRRIAGDVTKVLWMAGYRRKEEGL